MSIQIRVVGLVASAIVATAASAQTAVEWKASEGGNGHWYALTSTECWATAKAEAAARGGHLASITSQQEGVFVGSLLSALTQNYFVPAYVGGSRAPDSDLYTGWRWDTGEPFEPNAVPWMTYNPGCCGQGEWWLGVNREGHFGDLWDCITGSLGSVIEWSADCNSDGIVDYGQILRGELIDLNSNGVPDICETSISSVIPPSVPSQGGSTITIRGNFPPNPTVRVGGVVATNVNRTSITQITATVPALLPGMASVQVNDFTLPDAIYIRPECGSDLDQNGIVDAGDISIILLDFGPCYEQPVALADPAPTPLLADEPAQKPVQR